MSHAEIHNAQRATFSRFEAVPNEESKVILRHSRSFSVASMMLPAAVRSDVRKLYAWCRWCDDAVDESADVEQAKSRLQTLRNDVERIYRGEEPVHKASRWLAEIVERYEIEKAYPLELLDGMEMDLDLHHLRSKEELLRYCYHAAGVVGLMLCKIFGVSDARALRHAKSLGIAMQLTNIARDVREDSLRGRCYLPKTWLPDGPIDSTDPDLQNAVKRTLDLAEQYYAIGNAGIQFLPRRVRTAIRIASAVYREIGVQIRRDRYQVRARRTVVTKPRFAVISLDAWARGVAADLCGQTRSSLEAIPVTVSPSPATDFIMNDAKYVFYLGISLTSFMGCAAFVLVMLNPKDASYSWLPMVYALVCLAVGVVTNLLAKRAEAPAPVPIKVRDHDPAN